MLARSEPQKEQCSNTVTANSKGNWQSMIFKWLESLSQFVRKEGKWSYDGTIPHEIVPNCAGHGKWDIAMIPHGISSENVFHLYLHTLLISRPGVCLLDLTSHELVNQT